MMTAATVSAQDGAALYASKCQACHEGGAVTRAPARNVIAALPADRIVQSLESGLMREQGATLSTAERRAIAAYLSVARPATASDPNAALCKTPGPALRDAATGDWNGWGLSAANDRFQRSPGLTSDQVPNLQLKWAFGFEGNNTAAVQPVVVGGRVYVGTASGRLFSLDQQSGCVYWSFRADSGIRAAVTVGLVEGSTSPMVFLGDLSATVYGLDAATGEVRWKRRVEDHRAARISGSPVLYQGRLYAPVSSGEEATGAGPNYPCCTFRGSLVALRAATGEVVWKTYTIPEAPQPTIKNAVGTQMFGPNGAAIWHAPTLDPSTRSIYVATGDSYSAPAAANSDAIIAIDLETGAIKWSRQMLAGDAWNMACGTAQAANCADNPGPDHDFGQPPILVPLGNGRRALIAGQKSGQVHALDPDNGGRVLWSVRIAKGGMLGGLEWGSASDGQLYFAPASDITFKNPALYARGGVDPAVGGGVFALRVADGSTAWATPAPPCAAPCTPAQPSPASVIPGALFAGSLDGNLRAYSTADGKIIWTFNTAREFETVNGVRASGGSIDVGGPAIANGMVFTTSGYGTWGGKPGNVLLAFGVR